MIKLVVDSGCDLSPEMKNNPELKINIVPLSLQIGDTQYIDDSSLDVDAYIEHMESSPSVPKTAAPSPEAYLEQYKGEESIFAVTLSSKLSGSYNSAMLARQMYLDDIGSKFIHVFDSLSSSLAEALIALKVIEFSKLGFSNQEIVEKVNKFMDGMKTYFLLEKFDTAVKNGRMNPYVAKLASILSIKPICAAREGRMEVLEKARGYNNAVARLIEIMQQEGSDFENRILAISHVKCLNRALDMKEEILKKIKFKDVIICEMAGLCSTYASKGGIIISF